MCSSDLWIKIGKLLLRLLLLLVILEGHPLLGERFVSSFELPIQLLQLLLLGLQLLLGLLQLLLPRLQLGPKILPSIQLWVTPSTAVDPIIKETGL